MANERQFYDMAAQFLAEELGCFEVKKEVGTSFGIIDVLGIRQISKDLTSRYELVSVEVKESNARYLNSVGQAFAYSVCAHRCYLAYHQPRARKFTQEQIDIADHFGVGLISLSKSKEPKLISSSSLFTPKIEYSTWLIDKLGHFTCSLCGGIYRQNEIIKLNQPGKIDPTEDEDYSGKFAEAIEKRKNAKWYLYEMAEIINETRSYIYDRRFLCKDCISIFASIKSNA